MTIKLELTEIELRRVRMVLERMNQGAPSCPFDLESAVHWCITAGVFDDIKSYPAFYGSLGETALRLAQVDDLCHCPQCEGAA